MPHDELVEFAAGKVEVEVVAIKEKRYFQPTYPPDSTIASSGFSCQEIITRYVVKGTDKPFDLTSPDLFLKGLAVCPHHVSIKAGPDIHSRYVFVLQESGKHAMKFYDKVAEIPKKFWESWAEVEGRDHLTKEVG